MPLKKKLKSKDENLKVEEESSSSSFDDENSRSGEDSEDGDFDPNEEIMIDFEARSILESDYEPVKLLIQQKLSQFSLNLGELTKIIVEQENLGNAIYQAIENENEDDDADKETETAQNEDDTIFGVLSMVDLSSPKTKQFSTSFVQWLKTQAESSNKPISTKLNDLFKTKHISYIVNERYINIPPGISVPMFESLLKDIEGLGDESSDKKTDYWLFLIKIFVDESSKAKSSSKLNIDPEKVYANPEEEVFEEFSEFKFDISYGGKSSKAGTGKWSKDDPTLTPKLTVLFVPRSNISDALDKIKTLIK